MPQFNWSVLGPFAAILAVVAGSAVFLVSHRPQPRPVAVQAAAVRTATPARGVRLKGQVIGTPYLRPDPSSTAAAIEDLRAGEAVDVTACSDSCGWYLVTPAGERSAGWVSAAFIQLHGDETQLQSDETRLTSAR